MLYTLIAYKENSSDYCRGCLMDSYSSDFEAWTGAEAEELAERWAKLRDRNRNMRHGESGFDFLLFIDGVPAPYGDVQECDKGEGVREALWARQEELEPHFDYIKALTDSKLEAMDNRRALEAAEAARKAQLAKEEAERKAAAAKDAAERAEYERLSAKFGRKA